LGRTPYVSTFSSSLPIYTLTRLVALGIGAQAILPKAPAPPPLDNDELVHGQGVQLPIGLVNSVPHELSPVPHLIIETAPLRDSVGQSSSSGSDTLWPTGSQRSLSAMHTLMEQGGLVEIGPKADGSPLVITRTIGDTLALPTTPEDEVCNPTDVPLPPSPSSLPLPSPGLCSQDDLKNPFLTQSTSERLEEPIHSSVSGDSATAHVQPRLHLRPPLGRSDTSLSAVPPGLPVLVVDDDALTRTLMTRMLSRLGCKVSTAENGEVALEMVLSGGGGRFAIVFLDNQMPVMSGLSMVTKLREAGRSDFVVGVTGNALLSDQEGYLQAGVDRCACFPLSLFFLGFKYTMALRVLTKPVLERSLRNMLALASERLSLTVDENGAPPRHP
jgi:osomolarity two-component system, sensor histidine kinase SLN1